MGHTEEYDMSIFQVCHDVMSIFCSLYIFIYHWGLIFCEVFTVYNPCILVVDHKYLTINQNISKQMYLEGISDTANERSRSRWTQNEFLLTKKATPSIK